MGAIDTQTNDWAVRNSINVRVSLLMVISVKRQKQFILAILIVVLSSNYGISTVHAQTTSIQNLSYPTQRVTSPTASITFDVTFSGVSKGDILFAEIEDYDFRLIADGIASSTPDACMPLPARYNNTALCGWRPNATSGIEHLTFQLQISTRARIYNLEAYVAFGNSTGRIISTSVSTERFVIKGGTKLTLTVNVLNQVPVTIDGIQQPPGSVSIDVQPGVHSISVPNITSLDNSTRLVFGGWSDASTQLNRSDDLESDTVLAAEYIKQYRLTLISPVNATGAGWYYEGSPAQISVTGQFSGFLSMLGAKPQFRGWFENGQLIATSSNATIQMNGAHTLTAEWSTDYSIPIIIAVVIATIAGAIVVLHRRK